MHKDNIKTEYPLLRKEKTVLPDLLYALEYRIVSSHALREQSKPSLPGDNEIRKEARV